MARTKGLVPHSHMSLLPPKEDVGSRVCPVSKQDGMPDRGSWVTLAPAELTAWCPLLVALPAGLPCSLTRL